MTIDDYIKKGNEAYRNAMKIATRIQFDKIFGMDKDYLNGYHNKKITHYD